MRREEIHGKSSQSPTSEVSSTLASNHAMEEGEIRGSGGDELYNALHQRLVASGEWAKLSTLLKRMLDECGWETAFQQHAAVQARSQPATLSLPDLVDQLIPHAKGR